MPVPRERLPADLPIGDTSLRGLPFAIGPAKDRDPGERRLAAFGPGFGRSKGAVDLPAGTRHLIIAHATLDSDFTTDGLLGVPVAGYTIQFRDGGSETVAIRHRFEISCFGRGEPMREHGTVMEPVDVLTAVVLGKSFAAFGDRYDWSFPRYEGPWAASGRRMQEGIHAYPTGPKLWVWASPPDREPLLLHVGEASHDFVIAGATVGRLDEYPVALGAARPVRLMSGADRRLPPPHRLELTVDRGVATYPMRAAGARGVALSGRGVGWGERSAEDDSAYSRISAIPSATVAVRSGGGVLGRFRWGQLLEKQQLSRKGFAVELIDDLETWVHTTVVDRETGRPVPCRVHFRSAEGIPYAPHGHHAHLNFDQPSWNIDVGGDVRLGATTYAYIDGSCQGWLPVGDVTVEVARGFEYEPVRQTVRIEPGQRSLTLEIERWTDARRSGWYSGDTHVHFLSTSGAHLEAAGEDLTVVSLLQAQWGRLFTNVEDWSGSPSASDKFGTIVHVGQENRQHMLGHLGLLGLSRPIMPWSSDGAAEAELGGAIETTLSHWADQCHEQGGTVTVTHFGYSSAEMAALVATGRADAAEMIFMGPYFHEQYYRHLNAGFALPLVGGSDKMTGEVPVGIYRTYVHMDGDEPVTYENWCRNLRRGRTFLSAGPFLDLEVEGASIGDVVRVQGGGRVHVRASARTSRSLPVHTLQLVLNGRVVAESKSEQPATELHIDDEIAVQDDSWIAARAGGPAYFDAPLTLCAFRRGIFAHTSPVYLTTGSAWSRRDAPSLQYLLTLTEGTLEYVRTAAVRHDPGRRWHPRWTPGYSEFLERPLVEALDVISRRLESAKPR
jgi:hypothetical protein